MANIIKMTDLLKEKGIELNKLYTDKDKPPFKINEGKIGTGKYANIYDMKKEMKEGKFDPKNPTIAVTGLGVYSLQLLEKVIKKDLIGAAKNLGSERGIETLNYHLYERNQPLGSKIKGLWEVYQQMNTSQYKRAVTMYKRNK